MSFLIMAGPCALQNEEVSKETIRFLYERGVRFFRASIFKMRTCPDSWRGLRQDGIPLLENLRAEFPDMKLIAEVRSNSDWSALKQLIHFPLIGTRNAQNFDLIETIAQEIQPHQRIILKRGMGNSVKEWKDAARYVRSWEKVILCERGIKSFETATRNTLDLSAVPAIKTLNPEVQVIVDPSHATGDRRLVGPMIVAAKAAGADGVLVEVHPRPESSPTDSRQSLSFEEFDKALRHLEKVEAWKYETTRR